MNGATPEWILGWLQMLDRVKVRKRSTFDSSATPKAGERPKGPKGGR